MENIVLEKVITFSTCIEKLEEINFKDSLDYKLNEDGVSALGIIKIDGKIKTLKGYETFDDSIDVDIYAPFENIIEKDEFSLKIENVKHQIIRNNLILKITLSIEGFKRINADDDLIDDINLTNEIDDDCLSDAPLYNDEVIDEIINEDKKQEEVNEEKIIKNKKIEEVDGEKTMEVEKVIRKEIANDEQINKNWANDLFKLNNSYVLFYRIHRKEENQEIILVNDEVK